jgi:hypothetical protein
MIRKTFTVAVVLLALAGSAWAAPASPQTRQMFSDWYSCGFVMGAFQVAVKAGPAPAEDQALADHAQDSMHRVGLYLDARGPEIDADEFEAIRAEAKGPLKARMTRYDGQPDAAKGMRDEFRADLQACVAKADALVAPAPAGN